MHATNNEALREYAANAGTDDPARAWILTPWDVWVANPAYTGPAVRHPEADDDDRQRDYYNTGFKVGD